MDRRTNLSLSILGRKKFADPERFSLPRVRNRLEETQQKLTETEAIAEEMETHAVIDHLTGLLNRRMFDSKVEELVARHERYGNDALMVWMDLNKFKSVNDKFGHPAGDEMLQIVSEAMREVFRRQDDFKFRTGGDEFALILPEDVEDFWKTFFGGEDGLLENGSDSVFLRLNKAIDLGVKSSTMDWDPEYYMNETPIFVSPGLARLSEAEGETGHGTVAAKWAQLADDRMYEYKSKGNIPQDTDK